MGKTGIVFASVVLSLVLISGITISYFDYPSPKKQLESGVLPEDITCKGDDHVAVFRTGGDPACVKNTTAEYLGLPKIGAVAWVFLPYTQCAGKAPWAGYGEEFTMDNPPPEYWVDWTLSQQYEWRDNYMKYAIRDYFNEHEIIIFDIAPKYAYDTTKFTYDMDEVYI